MAIIPVPQGTLFPTSILQGQVVVGPELCQCTRHGTLLQEKQISVSSFHPTFSPPQHSQGPLCLSMGYPCSHLGQSPLKHLSQLELGSIPHPHCLSTWSDRSLQ